MLTWRDIPYIGGKHVVEHRSIWITWARQRRSEVLSHSFGAELHVLLERDEVIPFRPLRYTHLIIKTLALLAKTRAEVVFCQNPSLILATLLGLFRKVFGYMLVVDRHSNFWLENASAAKVKLYEMISHYSLKAADITIVTNEHLAAYTERIGGKSFVLQDRIPKLTLGGETALEGRHNIAYICSFAEDEAVSEVLEAAELLPPTWRVYITGNYHHHLRKMPFLNHPPSTVHLTGYLTEQEYQQLLRSVDVVMMLTKQEHTLMCGAYESVALGKPAISSDTEAMREYFTQGFVFSGHHPNQLHSAMQYAVDHRKELSEQIDDLRSLLEEDWDARFRELKLILNQHIRPIGMTERS